MLLAMIAAAALAQTPAIPSKDSAHSSTVVIGFVGGFVKNDDSRHPEVQIIQRLSKETVPAFHAAVYENRRTVAAREQILRWLDTDGDGHLSAQEKQNARIILFGHSWGGSAVLRLAKDLDRVGVPVLLTIQIDSVNRGLGHSCVIPANVAEATDFYQTRGLVHGCPALHVEDSHRTKITGSYEFEYTEQPVGCLALPWVDRHFLKTHNAMGCDPRVWSQVEDEIRAHLPDARHAEMGGHTPLIAMRPR
jgi:pimeloyl-ACP methyl ester carboxylesterase